MFANKQDNEEDSLTKIIDRQYKRLHELNGATVLIKGKHDIKNNLQQMHDDMLQISSGIENMRKVLERVKEQNTCSRELLSLIEALDKKILYQTENIPLELIQGYQNADKQTHVQTAFPYNSNNSNNSDIEKQEVMIDCKKTLFNEPEICPTIPFITAEEFHKVPKYIIGRQTLETINSLINTINQTLIMKYTILSLGKAVAQKKGKIDLYLHYKKQQLDIEGENEYLYFFTAEDYHRQTKTKLDKTKLNLMIALRHCKRLREYRIKNELRYVVTLQ